MKNNYQVEKAKFQDIPAILSVVNENLLINKDCSQKENIENSGFLMTRYLETDLQHWIENEEQYPSWVCKKDEEVVGYLLGSEMKLISTDLKTKFAEIDSLQEIMQTSKGLFHKQIAIKSHCKGAGQFLLNNFFEFARKNAYRYIVCYIVYEPFLNKVSIDFHQKHGFSHIGFIQFDNMKAGVYLKNLLSN